jgi:hypothetical protein
VQPTQQRFWPDPQPLVERLGRDFFRNVPERPGVYLMRGAGEIVLYVGKAKNLRKRLGSYRVANPERMPRRHLRLLRLVERIDWEECDDELAALRRESERLLALKPRFNRAGVWPRPERFIVWRSMPGGLELAVTETPVEGWCRFGPTGAQAIHLHRSLVRLLWCRLHPGRGLAGMPAGWFDGAFSGPTLIPHTDSALTNEAAACLLALVGGEFEVFRQWLLPPATSFEQQFREEDSAFVVDQLTRWQVRNHGARSITPGSLVSGAVA